MGGWLENELLKKTLSSKFGLEFQLGTSDFAVCELPSDVNSTSKYAGKRGLSL